jgi:hypothetical protein
MASSGPDYIRYVAEYEDGRKYEFTVSSGMVQRSDAFARLIARDRQAAGELPPGAIKNVRREVILGEGPRR